MTTPAAPRVCDTGRPDWLPDTDDIVEDVAHARIGKILSYTKGDGCTPGLWLASLGGTRHWGCLLSDARPWPPPS